MSFRELHNRCREKETTEFGEFSVNFNWQFISILV